MSTRKKVGLEGALEAAKAQGLKIKTRPAADIERDMAATIREVEGRITPETPARLKAGRPSKAEGPRTSVMKGVRLDARFLEQIQRRLLREHLTFSTLVQDLLGEWMQRPSPRMAKR